MKNFKKQFGGKVFKKNTDHYKTSAHWNNNKFQNLEETSMAIHFWDIPKIIYKQFMETADRMPSSPLTVLPLDVSGFTSSTDEVKMVWYGHSAILLHINKKTILIDPMLGPDASPISPSSIQRFSEGTLALIEQFPRIDLLLMSHDHYDHLDLDSIERLKKKTKHYAVALGVKRHLESWGIDEEDITELDWWESLSIEGIDITFTPSRHFSGRGITDRSKSLWGGWVFKTENESIWFSGDGGYGDHFKAIGEKLGPFDFAFMECGQYNEKWHQIHMFPEESVKAAKDAGVKKAMPVHWGGFALAQHTWTDPVERFIKSAQEENLPFIVPQLGELIRLNADYNQQYWWEKPAQ